MRDFHVRKMKGAGKYTSSYEQTGRFLIERGGNLDCRLFGAGVSEYTNV